MGLRRAGTLGKTMRKPIFIELMKDSAKTSKKGGPEVVRGEQKTEPEKPKDGGSYRRGKG
jgi:hypothetical protein